MGMDLIWHMVCRQNIPVWWAEIPGIMNTFAESYNFSEKTMIPCCTSGGSGVGSGATNSEAFTDDATWLSGIRLNGESSHETIADWVEWTRTECYGRVKQCGVFMFCIDQGELVMKKRDNYLKAVCLVLLCSLALTGCAKKYSTREKTYVKDEKEEPEEQKQEEQELEMEAESASIAEETGASAEDFVIEPETVCADWSEYFDGLNGAAVVYDVSNGQYTMYQRDLAVTRRSPCSTFKIISSLIALENGVLEPENSTRTWSSEVFWNEDWNRDIDFREAFRTSCVWYYRQLIDDIGKDIMQKELEKLQYGNCDISDWEGRLNTNNNNRALTGFWIESSLMISPREQTEVMERIFGEHSDYSEDTRDELKQVMLVSGQEQTDLSIYGKTGMGKTDGIVVDAWFTGFAERVEGNLYFCVYLGRTDGRNVSSSLAREIAIQIVSDYHLYNPVKKTACKNAGGFLCVKTFV